MGKRGPQPGFKKAREAAAAAASAPSAPAQEQDEPQLSAADRENPEKLSGQALRDLAHRRGLARSVMTTMPDEKIRMELRYITHRQYSEDAMA